MYLRTELGRLGGIQCGFVFLVRSKYVISLVEFPECCVPTEFVLEQPRGAFAFTTTSLKYMFKKLNLFEVVFNI